MDLHPRNYHAGFTQERLDTIAAMLLGVVHASIECHDHPLDDLWTRNTTIFGRMKNCLERAAASNNEYSWLHLVKGGNDLVLAIEGVPFRFATEYDAEHPKKAHILRQSSHEKRQMSQMALDFPEGDIVDPESVKYRFYVEAPGMDDQDGEVNIYFMGLGENNQKLFMWRYGAIVSALYPVASETLPPAVETPEPGTSIPPRRNELDEEKGDVSES